MRGLTRLISVAAIGVGLLLIFVGLGLFWLDRGNYRLWRSIVGYDGCACGDCRCGIFGASGSVDVPAPEATVMGSLLVLLGVIIIQLRRALAARVRARDGCCTGCGYDRAGLAQGAACPECGREPLYGDGVVDVRT